MELILINESKLKIMLDEQDMKEYNIGDESDCSHFETRKAIRDILDRARDEIGFNTEGAEIFVQLYSSKKGGCELFVTKSTLIGEGEREDMRADTDNDRKSRRKDTPKAAKDGAGALSVRKATLPQSKRMEGGRLAFSFLCLEDLCAVCRRLNKIGAHVESKAFRDAQGNFYLLLSNTGMSAYTRLDKLTFIVEFGARERFDDVCTYLSEHGSIICEDDAVEILSAF